MISHEPRLRAVDAANDRVRPLALSLIALALSVAACGRVPGQFEIVQNQVPQPGCLIDTSETLYRGDGTLDLALVQPGALAAYIIFPLLKNNLPASTAGPGSESDRGQQLRGRYRQIPVRFAARPGCRRCSTDARARRGPARPNTPCLHYSVAVVGSPRVGRRHGGRARRRLPDRSRGARRRDRRRRRLAHVDARQRQGSRLRQARTRRTSNRIRWTIRSTSATAASSPTS